MDNTIYLSGTHRTGKTYLASNAARCLRINFKEANLSEAYAHLNTTPQASLAPTMYLPIQELMLARMNSTYINTAGIVDRSHIDLAAYAIYHVRNNPELNSWLTGYVERCMNSIPKDAVIVSVPLSSLNIEEASKSFSKDSAQAIQDILQGLYLHPLLKAKVVHIPVETTKVYERVQVIADIVEEQQDAVSNDNSAADMLSYAKLVNTINRNSPITGSSP